MIVVIGDTQWACSVASTPADIAQGLSGLESIPTGQGMLFDLGVDYSRIDINMQEMLFPIDIVFINSNFTVVGVLHDVQPNDEAYFEASNSLGARYLMEVNAGEAASVNVGDTVAIQNGPASGIDADTIAAYTIAIMMVIAIGGMIYKALK